MRYLVVLLLLAGCSTQASAPIRMGKDVHMITGRNTAIGASSSDVVADLHRRAWQFCERSRQDMEVVSIDTHGPGLARFPEGRIQFRCVAR